MSENASTGEEKLVVRWKTEGKGEKIKPEKVDADNGNGNGSGLKQLTHLLGADRSNPLVRLGKGEEFTGLFIFEFDSEGRIESHTIEHADEAGGTDRTAKVVTLTDWLLGRLGGKIGEPGLAGAAVCGSEGGKSRR